MKDFKFSLGHNKQIIRNNKKYYIIVLYIIILYRLLISQILNKPVTKRNKAYYCLNIPLSKTQQKTSKQTFPLQKKTTISGKIGYGEENPLCPFVPHIW